MANLAKIVLLKDKDDNKIIPITDYTAVNGLNDELNKKVNKVDGKALSTNDFTNEYKNKLDNLDTTSSLAVDEEDLTIVDGVAKFKDRDTSKGRGYKILRYSSNGVLTQEAFRDVNTTYEIRYNFTLNNASITLPENCILKFNGGSISNGTLCGGVPVIEASYNQFGILKNVKWNSSMNPPFQDVHIEWFSSSNTGNITDFKTAVANAVTFSRTIKTAHEIRLNSDDNPIEVAFNLEGIHNYIRLINIFGSKANIIKFNGNVTFKNLRIIDDSIPPNNIVRLIGEKSITLDNVIITNNSQDNVITSYGLTIKNSSIDVKHIVITNLKNNLNIENSDIVFTYPKNDTSALIYTTNTLFIKNSKIKCDTYTPATLITADYRIFSENSEYSGTNTIFGISNSVSGRFSSINDTFTGKDAKILKYDSSSDNVSIINPYFNDIKSVFDIESTLYSTNYSIINASSFAKLIDSPIKVSGFENYNHVPIITGCIIHQDYSLPEVDINTTLFLPGEKYLVRGVLYTLKVVEVNYINTLMWVSEDIINKDLNWTVY